MIERLRLFAQKMKLQLRVLYLASRDPRTPLLAKLLLIVVVAYALSPIDLIPDFIPIIGYLDDLIILPLGIYLAIRLVPPQLWQELQVRAQTQSQPLPKNYRAAVLVAAIWLVILVALIYWLWQHLST